MLKEVPVETKLYGFRLKEIEFRSVTSRALRQRSHPLRTAATKFEVTVAPESS